MGPITEPAAADVAFLLRVRVTPFATLKPER